jgi:protoporphyrinogen oxidase
MKNPIVIIGAGFTGLAAAHEIARRGMPVVVLEKEASIGGLAASFKINDQQIEKFYHHWFNNDRYVIELVNEINRQEEVLFTPTVTAIYLNKKFYRLSSPMDLLRFGALNILDRIRLGLLVLKARRIKNWKELDTLSAEEWLVTLCGRNVYETVWQPLLRGKFGPYADQISAVWIWNKLVLRGGSRDKAGGETLAYYRGGFGELVETIAEKIKSSGGIIKTSAPAEEIIVRNGRAIAVKTPAGVIDAEAVIATPALPVIANLLSPYVSGEYLNKLRAVKYMANVCLVLELSHRLSDFYWLNVSDNDFPFIGVIEHTNFQNAQDYSGRHVVYMSKYFPEESEVYHMSEEKVFEFTLPYIKRMFPDFDKSWILRYYVWKARYAQPVVVRGYSSLIPSNKTPIDDFYIATMAQVYPEDRGTNYAIREGRRVGRMVIEQMGNVGTSI